ncbi:MAG: hypothetical protein ACRD0H_24200, partial [Actinomycetes bacterium]
SSVWIDFFADRATWQVEEMSLRPHGGEQSRTHRRDVVLTDLLQRARDDVDLARRESYLLPSAGLLPR